MICCSPLHVQDGQTALYIACKKGNDQIVELLLKKEADINHQTKVRLLMLVCVLLHCYIPYHIFLCMWPWGFTAQVRHEASRRISTACKPTGLSALLHLRKSSSILGILRATWIVYIMQLALNTGAQNLVDCMHVFMRNVSCIPRFTPMNYVYTAL